MAEEISLYSDRCWIGDSLQPATITYIAEKIIAVDYIRLPSAIDYSGYIIMPGIIDAHVHVNEPGRTDWEGFDTATMAAAAGGITSIIDMPLNASPVTTTVAAFREKLNASKGKLNVNCGFYGGLIPGHRSELESLVMEGILGVKCFLVHSGIDEFPDVKYEDIAEVLPMLSKKKIPLLAHCEIESIPATKTINTYPDYLKSRPKQWENDAVGMMIELAEKFDAKVHIVHVSSAETLTAIQQAKSKGIKLTAETCPQYIYFSAEDIPEQNTLYKCAPPIRERSNNDLLKQALKNGTLNFIASDHSPAPPEIKLIDTGDLKNAWGGIAGLQFLLPASWTALKDDLSLESFIPLVTSQPAAFLQLHSKGKIETGRDADLVIWSPDEKMTIKEKDILHRHRQSPYTGNKLQGVVHSTIVNGKIVYQNNRIINKNSGKWLFRQ